MTIWAEIDRFFGSFSLTFIDRSFGSSPGWREQKPPGFHAFATATK
jgi:hypothetical protein